MQAQAQFTIHSLNDVVTSATAPTNPYKGQLWMKSSVTPPVLYTYNGSSWVEANGTSTLRSNITTLTTKEANLESNLNGLTSTVSTVTTRVTTLEDDYGTISEDVEVLEGAVSVLRQTSTALTTRISNAEGKITTHTTDISGLKTRVTNAEGDITDLTATIDGVESRVETAEGNISTITQNVTGITSRVSTAEGNISSLQQADAWISMEVALKADKDGGSQSSFGWSLDSDGFYLYSNSNTVLTATSSGITVNGEINTTSGTIGNLTIGGILYFGGNSEWYIDPNYEDHSFYVSLPGLRIDEGSGAVFSGNLSAPSGNIGGFTISTSSIYKTKTSYASTTSGVYLGTDGIGLGAGTFYVSSAGYLYSKSGSIGGFTITASSIYKTKSSYSSTTSGVYVGNDGIGLGAGSFYVTSAGYLYATNASITGSIYASGGTIGNLTIIDRLSFGGNEEYYLDPNYDNGSWNIYLKNFRVDDTNAYFSGQLSAPTGNIGGFTIATSKIYKSKTTYNSTTAGVYIGTDGIGLGAAKFYVTSNGDLTATSATITGTISNVDTAGWGIRIVDNRIEIVQHSNTISQIYGSSGYYNAKGNAVTNGMHISSLLHVGGDLVCGRCLGISTGNGIYVSGKLALTMGQIKVSSGDTFIGGSSSRYLLIYCGLIVGISESAYSGIYDYTEKTYTG